MSTTPPRPILKRSARSYSAELASEAALSIDPRAANALQSPSFTTRFHTESPSSPKSCSLTRAKTTPNSGNRVHFPPSPRMHNYHTCYSAAIYDRSPIVVTPNSTAMPERGCPGRTYTLDSDDSAEENEDLNDVSLLQRGHNLFPSPKSPVPITVTMGDMHPRSAHFLASTGINVPLPCADERAERKEAEQLLDKLEAEAEAKEWARQESQDTEEDTPIATQPPYKFPLPVLLPSLIPDFSSESEESDGFVSPPEDGLPFMVGFSPQVNHALLGRSSLSGLSLTNPDNCIPYSYSPAFAQPNPMFNTNNSIYTPHDFSYASDKPNGTDTPTSPSTPVARSFSLAGPSEEPSTEDDDGKFVRERRRTRVRRRPSRVIGGNEEDDEAEPEELARRMALANYRASSFRSSSPFRPSSPLLRSYSPMTVRRSSSPMRYRPDDALSIPRSPASLPPPSPGFMRSGLSTHRSGSPLRGGPVFRSSSWSSTTSSSNINTSTKDILVMAVPMSPPVMVPSSPPTLRRTRTDVDGDSPKTRLRRKRVVVVSEDGSVSPEQPRRRTRPAYRHTSASLPSCFGDDDAGCLGGF